MALLISQDPLGDQIELMSLSYPVANVEAVQEALAALPQAVPMAVDPAHLPEGARRRRPPSSSWITGA